MRWCLVLVVARVILLIRWGKKKTHVEILARKLAPMWNPHLLLDSGNIMCVLCRKCRSYRYSQIFGLIFKSLNNCQKQSS